MASKINVTRTGFPIHSEALEMSFVVVVPSRTGQETCITLNRMEAELPGERSEAERRNE